MPDKQFGNYLIVKDVALSGFIFSVGIGCMKETSIRFSEDPGVCSSQW